jgi:hypothetical protein
MMMRGSQQTFPLPLDSVAQMLNASCLLRLVWSNVELMPRILTPLDNGVLLYRTREVCYPWQHLYGKQHCSVIRLLMRSSGRSFASRSASVLREAKLPQQKGHCLSPRML